MSSVLSDRSLVYVIGECGRAHVKERFDGVHNFRHDLRRLRDLQLLVVQAEKVVVVAGLHQEHRLAHIGQRRQALVQC